MRKQARPVRNPLSGPDSGQRSGQQPPQSPAVPPRSPNVPPRSPAVPPRNGASGMRLESQGTSSDTYMYTYKEAETVYHTIKDEDLPPSLVSAGRQAGVESEGPPSQSPAGHQPGFNGRARHGEGASGNLQDQDGDEETEAKKGNATNTSTRPCTLNIYMTIRW
ncbi:hypothetical protein Bbelb_278050 [Branchiostoma belcheri]|nr:hypothetical protein Bbelb_278050 [Branchiostoma belcheri]